MVVVYNPAARQLTKGCVMGVADHWCAKYLGGLIGCGLCAGGRWCGAEYQAHY